MQPGAGVQRMSRKQQLLKRHRRNKRIAMLVALLALLALGVLVAGIVIGPNALALAQNSETVKHLGELGVSPRL